MKICSDCGIEKSESAFSKHKRNPDGLERYCKECRKLRRQKTAKRNAQVAKEWREANPDRARSNRERWIAANREKYEQAKRHWAKGNQEQCRQASARYRRNNQSKVRERNRRYRELNRDKVRQWKRNRHRQLQGAIGKFSAEEWLAKCDAAEWRCHYCGRELDEFTVTQEHLQPISRNGTNFLSNVVPACGPCNSRKHTKTESEFLGINTGIASKAAMSA